MNAERIVNLLLEGEEKVDPRLLEKERSRLMAERRKVPFRSAQWGELTKKIAEVSRQAEEAWQNNPWGLRSESEDDEMLQRLVRIAIDPLYQIEDALTNNTEFKKTFHAPGPWAYDIEINISGPAIPGHSSKLRFIQVRWSRPDYYQGLVRGCGGGYASYDVKDTPAIVKALGRLIYAAKISTVGSIAVSNAYDSLIALRWVSKSSTGRRRGRNKPGWFIDHN